MSALPHPLRTCEAQGPRAVELVRARGLADREGHPPWGGFPGSRRLSSSRENCKNRLAGRGSKLAAAIQGQNNSEVGYCQHGPTSRNSGLLQVCEVQEAPAFCRVCSAGKRRVVAREAELPSMLRITQERPGAGGHRRRRAEVFRGATLHRGVQSGETLCRLRARVSSVGDGVRPRTGREKVHPLPGHGEYRGHPRGDSQVRTRVRVLPPRPNAQQAPAAWDAARSLRAYPRR